jgi:hypothetical protein
LNTEQRKAMYAKRKGQYRPAGTYTRDEINQIRKQFGKQGTTKFYGSGCQWCGSNDATFKHYRNVGGGKVSEVRCIRCKQNAGM